MAIVNNSILDKTLEGDQMGLPIEFSPEPEDYIKIPSGRACVVRSVPDSLDRACEKNYAGKYFRHSYSQLIQK